MAYCRGRSTRSQRAFKAETKELTERLQAVADKRTAPELAEQKALKSTHEHAAEEFPWPFKAALLLIHIGVNRY